MAELLNGVTTSVSMRMSDLPSETDDQGPGDVGGPAELPVDQAAETAVQPPETTLDTDRYAQLSLANGEYVIYDREVPDMWIQSDLVVEVGP